VDNIYGVTIDTEEQVSIRATKVILAPKIVSVRKIMIMITGKTVRKLVYLAHSNNNNIKIMFSYNNLSINNCKEGDSIVSIEI